MKNILVLISAALLITGCSPVKTHNKHLTAIRSVAQLKEDTDFAYNKLKKLHPQLYWYISKEKLDYKFDSLKTTITNPMTSFEFFKKISPVVASVGQGHMNMGPPMKRYTKAEQKAFAAKGVGPFSQFEFEYVNGKMYVIKNKSYVTEVAVGSELTAVNGKPVADLLNEYRTFFASDGYNTTFKNKRMPIMLPMYFSAEHGYVDSVKFNFNYHDSVRHVNILRKVIDTAKAAKKPEAKKSLSKADKQKAKAERIKKSIYGYNEGTKLYNRNLHFKESDSSVAVLTIRGFSIGSYAPFYKKAFEDIKKHNSSTLIIDLRNNPGGRLAEIAMLYKFLADSTYTFADRSLVTSRTSMFHADYFRGSSVMGKVGLALVSPLYYGFTFFNTHKDDQGRYYVARESQKLRQPDPNGFKGRIFVLVNGGSFSASSIISSNLKGSNRAFFVGEEAGGAFNGTVAGRMPLFRLPNSKVALRFGLMFIAPHHKNETEGRGVFPDKEIIPTLEDRIAGRDPEMEWIMQEITAVRQTAITQNNQ